jgi:hypothetical protein
MAAKNAPVAQLDRVADYESAGHGFESCLARQRNNKGWAQSSILLLQNDPQMISGCSAVWLARLVWDQKVAGSNPAIPTNELKVPMKWHFLFLIVQKSDKKVLRIKTI